MLGEIGRQRRRIGTRRGRTLSPVELQKDVTMQVLRSIDGVRDIEVNLTKF